MSALKILKFFIAVAFIFFLFMVIVQFDMGRNKFAICSSYERSFNYVSKISGGCFADISSLFQTRLDRLE